VSPCTLIHRRPPQSPLFPYTTLFRSEDLPCRELAGRRRIGRPDVVTVQPGRVDRGVPELLGRDQRAQEARVGGQPEDRGVVERRSEEHTSELQSRRDLVCRLLLEKKN